MHVLLAIVLLFSLLSLIAVGGGNAVIPPMFTHSVTDLHWLTPQEFVHAFALARAMPGPSTQIAAIVGFKAAGTLGPLVGALGALLATLCMFVPSSILMYFSSKFWVRWKGRPWQVLVEAGLAPVGIGLIGAASIMLGRHSWSDWILVGIGTATLLVTIFTKLNPLIPMLVAGVIGALLPT